MVIHRVSRKDFAGSQGNTDFWEPIDREFRVVGGEGILERDRQVRKLVREYGGWVEESEIENRRP